jgi:signal transduction histidine kinase
MFLFALLALRSPPAWLRHAVLAYLPVALVLSVASFALGRGALWTAALQLLAPLGIVVWLAVVNEARRRGPGRTVARALGIAGLVALATGLYDLGVIRLGLGPPSQFSVTPHAIFIFVLVMAGIIVDRYARTAAGLAALNRTLDQRVQARETELRDAFGQLQAQQAAQATSNERQRIMRDLHDGVGAQLVALLNLIRQPQAQPDVLKEHVEAALDEMRLAVDSMQIADGDLVTALATLRYRVQPRVQAAGLTLHWEVQDLPALAAMTPTAVLQVQRILLEALTNVLKHARARTVWVRCALQDGSGVLLLEVADDGAGVPADAGGPGQGLQNMRLRAEALGGRVAVEPRPGGGTRVQLALPVAAAPAGVNP